MQTLSMPRIIAPAPTARDLEKAAGPEDSSSSIRSSRSSLTSSRLSCGLPIKAARGSGRPRQRSTSSSSGTYARPVTTTTTTCTTAASVANSSQRSVGGLGGHRQLLRRALGGHQHGIAYFLRLFTHADHVRHTLTGVGGG